MKPDQADFAPEGYHATTIFPEYFRVGGRWLLAEDSRMDCVAVYRDGAIRVLDGEESLKKYTGKKVFEKFDFEP